MIIIIRALSPKRKKRKAKREKKERPKKKEKKGSGQKRRVKTRGKASGGVCKVLKLVRCLRGGNDFL